MRPLRRIQVPDEILAAPEPFVILALPASGTSWFTNGFLSTFNRKIWHESLGISPEQQRTGKSVDYPPTASIMTWKLNDDDLANNTWVSSDSPPKWEPKPKFQAFFYHTRNPLHQVFSCAVLLDRMRSGRPKMMLAPCGLEPKGVALLDAMRFYIRFHERAVVKTDAWYRVEDVTCLDWPGKNRHNKDKTPTWDELRATDKETANRLLEVAKELGYE